MTEWAPYEDAQRATSRHRESYDAEQQFVWELEVREYLVNCNLRLGDMKIRGSFDGELLMSIQESGIGLL